MAVQAVSRIAQRRSAVVRHRRWRPSPLPWILPLILLVAWQASLSFGLFQDYQLAPPATVIKTAIQLAGDGQLQTHVVATGVRVLAGFVIGSVAALLIGTAVGLFTRLDRAVDPTFQALRTVPTLAWAPLLLLWLGIDEAPKITLVAIGAFFPVYINLIAGIRGVDRKLVEVGYMYNLSTSAIARRIILPACLPNLLTGLRLSLSQAWLFVVVAELIAATRGLGFLLTDSQTLSRVDLMLVAMLTLAILGKVTDSLLRALEQRLLSWRDAFAGEGSAS